MASIGDKVVLPTMAALKALTSRPHYITLSGYYTSNDGGGGDFIWVAGDSSTANDGTVVTPTGSPAGRYKRLYSGAIDLRWFGAKGDGSTDDTTFIQLAFNLGANTYIVSNGNFV